MVEWLLTALTAVLLSFLVAMLVAAVVGGGGDVVDVGGGRRRSGSGRGKRVRFVGVEERLVVNRFEEQCGSETAEEIGGYEGVESVVVGEDRRQFEEISEYREVSRLTEVWAEKSLQLRVDGSVGNVVDASQHSEWIELEETGGVAEENVVYSSSNEAVCSSHGDELFEEEGEESEAMNIEDSDCGGEEIEKELRDEVADRIEECIRKVEGGVIEDENSVNEGCKNEFEETAEPRDVHFDELFEEEKERETQAMDVEDADGGGEEVEKELKDEVADRIEEYIRSVEGGVLEEENSVNEFEEMPNPKDVHLDIKEEVTEERFGSSVEDDWEGIEMSDLDNDFQAAAAFVSKVEKDGKLSNIGSEVNMQLYGLQKIVIEGPCREAQPMALKMSARAKWNAWQRLGNMNPEDAMKQYIALVSGMNLEWEEQNAGVDDQSENVEAKMLSISDPGHSKPQNGSQKKKELTYNAEGTDIGSSSL